MSDARSRSTRAGAGRATPEAPADGAAAADPADAEPLTGVPARACSARPRCGRSRGRWTCVRPSGSGRTSCTTRTRCAGSCGPPSWRRTTSCWRSGPVSGSLTLGLLEAAAAVYAVEIDPVLAHAAARDGRRAGTGAGRPADVVTADALRVPGRRPACARRPPWSRTCPTTSACRWCCTCWPSCPSLRRGLVMVQAEVAERLAAAPGSRTYGVPSAKLAWFAAARRAGPVPRAVFWPVPNVDSACWRSTAASRRRATARRRLRRGRRGVRAAPQGAAVGAGGVGGLAGRGGGGLARGGGRPDGARRAAGDHRLRVVAAARD